MADETLIPPPDNSGGGWKSKLRSHLDSVKQRLLTVSGARLSQLKAYIEKNKNLQEAIRGFEPSMIAEWTTRTFKNQNASFYGKLATLVLCTYFLADLTSLVAGHYIPEPPMSRSVHFGEQKHSRSIEDYNVIFARNLFNSQGIIPGEETPGGPGGVVNPGGTPIKTTLPFNLVGTMIMADELRSIATIEDKTASMVYPVRVEDEIPGKAKITKIEAKKVIFINTAAQRLEYIDIPETLDSTAPKITLGTKPGAPGAGIEKVAPTQFNIARDEVDKTLSNLNEVLTQARAVPHFENGQPSGYKLFQIVPGSIYDKLGLQNGDVIAGLGGEPVNDPGKAFEMLNQLKTSSHLELTIKRDGKPSTFTYDIH